MSAPTPPPEAYKVVMAVRIQCVCRRCGRNWLSAEPPRYCASCRKPRWWLPAVMGRPRKDATPKKD
jgi:hypothetical protein